MTYTLIKEKLDKGKIIILDGAIGGELEKLGAPMDKDSYTSEYARSSIRQEVHTPDAHAPCRECPSMPSPDPKRHPSPSDQVFA